MRKHLNSKYIKGLKKISTQTIILNFYFISLYIQTTFNSTELYDLTSSMLL